ncbi:MAG TPA: YihY/virulence factor BrkB family protein [Mollicutes bacterium]|nr:YihY/virulence factor BrkB family protein [Mollicutes bacterium]
MIKKLKRFIKDIWSIIKLPETAILPGQIAFFVILSLVPVITLIVYGANIFGISIDTIGRAIEVNFSSEVAKMVMPIISGDKVDITVLILFINIFYIASSGADSIIFVSNEIYNIKQSSWWRRRLKAIVLTIAIVILVLFVMLVPAYGERIISALDYFNITSVIAPLYKIIQGPISWLIMFMIIKVIYTISPDKPLPSSKVNLGAAFTTIGWVLVTMFYRFLTTNFSRYDLLYGGLSNIAILMLWIYFLSYIFVIGMSLNSLGENKEMEKTGSIKTNF